MARESLPRKELSEFLPNQRAIRTFEQTFQDLDANTEGVAEAKQEAEGAQQSANQAQQTADDAVAATNSIKGATMLVLSPDTTLTNERVLTAGNLIAFDDAGPGDTLTVRVDGLTLTGGFTLDFTLTANTSITLPTTGTLSTLGGTEDLANKTLDSLRVQDAFAAGAPTATGSIPVEVDGVTKYIMLADAP